ncbi:MAG: hypothetical protein HYR60_25250 [Acidobacteria bacterium]|nr:hypothetical protein [Acidobacteriota bacterium]
MASGFSAGLKRFIWWEYNRGSWQYDVMVGLILAFIFFTPRAWFRDQPRIPRASNVAMLPGDPGVYWVDAALLESVPEEQRVARASAVVKTRIARVQPIIDDEEAEVKGYLAFTKP